MRARGFSLVELMIAMVIGLVVIGGAITVFSGSRSTSELNRTVTELQESARFALGSIVRDVRMAGFQGCADVNTSPAAIQALGAPVTDLAASAFTASRVETDGTWTPAPPAGFTPPASGASGAPVPGTHAIVVQFGNPVVHRIEPMALTSSPVVLADTDAASASLVAGDYALVSNCSTADVFRISGTAGSTLQHLNADNASNLLSANYGAGNTPGANETRAFVMRFESNVYYVGDTGRTNAAGDRVRALYRQTLPYGSAANPPIEMVEGVANLKVRLGHRAEAPDTSIRYVRPGDAPPDAGGVDAVEIGLLLESHDPVADAPGGRGYRLAGIEHTGADAPASAATGFPRDRRMRLAFNASVAIRNRR